MPTNSQSSSVCVSNVYPRNKSQRARVSGSHNSPENKSRKEKFWQLFQVYYDMCHAKYNQNLSSGTRLGHGVSTPWNDGQKFQLRKIRQQVPSSERTRSSKHTKPYQRRPVFTHYSKQKGYPYTRQSIKVFTPPPPLQPGKLPIHVLQHTRVYLPFQAKLLRQGS